jgi:hypothetical protein
VETRLGYDIPKTYSELLACFDDAILRIKLSKKGLSGYAPWQVVKEFKRVSSKYLDNNKKDIVNVMDLVFTINMFA